MSAQDHAKVAEAICKAEQTTAGEIYCVVARSSDSYYFAAAFVSLLSILAVSLGLAIVIEMQWFSLRLPWFVAAQLLAFAGLHLLLVARPGLALLLAPRRLQFARAHDNAVKQFLARNVHITAERTGVRPTLEQVERRYIDLVLREVKGSQTRAAAILGISRKALWEKRRRYGFK